MSNTSETKDYSEKIKNTEIYKNNKNNINYNNCNNFSKSFHNLTQYLTQNINDNEEKNNPSNLKKLKEVYREKLENYFSNDSHENQRNNNNIEKDQFCYTENIYKNNDTTNDNNFKNLNLIKENTYSLTYYNNEKNSQSKNIYNEIDQEFNLKESINKKYPNINETLNIVVNDSSKKLIDDDLSKYYVSNHSSIENEKNNNSINKFPNLYKNDENDKETIDMNMYSIPMNNINNDDIQIDQVIYDVNYIKPRNSSTNIGQLANYDYNFNDYNFNDNNINERYYKINAQKKNFIKNVKTNNNIENNKSVYNNENNFCVKNKLYQFYKKINTENNSNNNSHRTNLRIKVLEKKIHGSKNKNNYFGDDEKIMNEPSYPGLKRYQNYSTPCLKQFQIGTNNFNSKTLNGRRHYKINILKKAINNICNINNSNFDLTNQNFTKNDVTSKLNNDIKKNLSMRDIYKTMTKQNNDNNKNHLDSILEGLNFTIKKFPKNEKTFYSINNESANKTSNTFCNYLDLKERNINHIIKNNKNKALNINTNDYRTNFNEYSDKNKKLLFETKINNMNNTIIKLLHRDSGLNNRNNGTKPANIFKKNKSNSKLRIINKNSWLV